MKRMIWCVVVALVGLWQPASAQELFPDAEAILNPGGRDKIKPSTFNFLKVSTNARISGMGDAFTAGADGMDGAVWNPSGLTSIERVGYSLGYTKWLADSKFWSGAIVYKTDYGVVGASVVSLQFPSITETTTLEPDGTGRTVDVGDIAIGLIYAKQLTDKLSVAGTGRYIQSKLGAQTLSALSFNVSTLMHTGYRSLRLGMNMKNLGGEQEIVSQQSEMPLVFHTGLALEVYGNLGDPVSLTTAFEGAYFTDREQRWNLGGELWLHKVLALRAGYKFRYDEESWSAGVGAKGKFGDRHLQVDVSYSDFGNLFDAPLRLTLSGEF